MTKHDRHRRDRVDRRRHPRAATPGPRTDAAHLAEDAQRAPSSPTWRSSPRSLRRGRRPERTTPATPHRRGPVPAHQTPRRLRPRRRTHHQPSHIATLATGAYLDAGEPVVLLGDSGTGKSHLLIGLGIAACEQGRRVRYVTAAQLVNELAEAADERRLSRIVTRYGRLDLLCLDELGYVQLDTRGAELLFQILTEREEKASIAVASNLLTTLT
jgi:hypothetical protein